LRKRPCLSSAHLFETHPLLGAHCEQGMRWVFKEYASLASTQSTAERFGRGGAREGTVVLAEAQTAGRGRFGRRWASPRGGLYMSMILRPARHDSPHLLTLAGALSVVDGLKVATGVDSGVRWPNDVMVMERKLAGVIATAGYSGPSPDYVVVGIGVNCNVSGRSLGKVRAFLVGGPRGGGRPEGCQGPGA
jgi:biotin-[acetyl-CoA-carboxylase] ligase BirA-like protein